MKSFMHVGLNNFLEDVESEVISCIVFFILSPMYIRI